MQNDTGSTPVPTPADLIKNGIVDGSIDFTGFWSAVENVNAALDKNPHLATFALTYVLAKRLQK